MNAQDFFERYKWKGAKDSIGSGGFGKVFRAEDTLRNRKVAIKNSFVDSHKFTLKREVELVNEIEPHPNVLRYENYYRFEVNNEIMDYAIMPFYEYGNLSNVIKGGTLNQTEKLQITNGIVAAMAHLHRNKIVHRDLKPSNILMDFQNGKWIPKVADFGLSRFKTDVEQSVSNSSVGRSMPYAAPEQLMNGGKVNLYTDVWALGTVLYELYAGRRAFESDDSKTNSADVQLYHQIVEEQLPNDIESLPSPINTIVAGCLVSDGKKRQTIGQIADVLGSADDATILLANVAAAVDPPRKVNKVISNFEKKQLVTAAALITGIVLITAFLLWTKQPEKLRQVVDNEIVEPISKEIKEKDSTLQLVEAKVIDLKKTIFSEAPAESSLITDEKKVASSGQKVASLPIETSPTITPPVSEKPKTTLTTTPLPIQVEVKTNKGQRANNFVEGEEMKLYFKVDSPGFVRFVYRLADGSLVLLHDDYEVPASQVNKWVQVGTVFECEAPFGSEEVIVFTSTEHFNSLKTRFENGYNFIEEGLPAVISKSKSRGMKAKRDPVISTKSMNITTKPI